MILLGSVQRLELEQLLEQILTPGPNMTFKLNIPPVTDLRSPSTQEDEPSKLPSTDVSAAEIDITPATKPVCERQVRDSPIIVYVKSGWSVLR